MEKLASNEVMEERLSARWQEAQRAAEARAKQALSRLNREEDTAAPPAARHLDQDAGTLST